MEVKKEIFLLPIIKVAIIFKKQYIENLLFFEKKITYMCD